MNEPTEWTMNAKICHYARNLFSRRQRKPTETKRKLNKGKIMKMCWCAEKMTYTLQYHWSYEIMSIELMSV